MSTGVRRQPPSDGGLTGGIGEGSGASRDFGREKTRWRTEGRQAANQECLISSPFSSVTGVTRSASEAELGLLSADAPEPDPFPGSPRHNPGTPNLSWSQTSRN